MSPPRISGTSWPMIGKNCMRDVLFICKISTEIYFGKWKKKFSKKFKIFTVFFFFFFFNFFLSKNLFWLQNFFFQPNFFLEIFFRFSFLLFCAGRGASAASGGGGVGERSKPPAGGLAQAPEGGVSASTIWNTKSQKVLKKFFIVIRNS